MNDLVEVTHTVTEIQFEKSNEELFMKSLALIDPLLWRIKKYLVETHINPEIIPAVIEQLAMVGNGSGYGDVTIYVKDRKAIKVEGTDSKLLNLSLSEN